MTTYGTAGGTYSDIPQELQEKIKLWEVLNKILKNNGFIDAEAITNDLANLKQQINILLADVLGLEHEIDGVHNYDDTDLKTKLQNLNTSIEGINSDINNLSNRLSGISTSSSQVAITNLTEVKLSTRDTNNNGTLVDLSPNQIALINDFNGVYYGHLTLGGGSTTDGISMESDNDISIFQRSGGHKMKITANKVELTDVNGLKISYNADGVIITDYTNTNVAHIPWE
jgi:hypothetical protein